ncbi:uncharacterized protein JCM15063_000625 [Sporobolomyces koalae]|uniref:uncharacterized protein n=1 Tax=Sporobolomyces koalae TaxID=500713 RepID=UPI0031814C1D
MPTLIETVKAAQNLDKVLFPPLCFSVVLPGVFRSGHPNRHNFAYLDSLGLRSIMYLSPDDYRHVFHSILVDICLFRLT